MTMQVPVATADAHAGRSATVDVRTRGHALVVDHDSGPAPLDLMMASLASCSAMSARTQLRRAADGGDSGDGSGGDGDGGDGDRGVHVVVTLDAGPPTVLHRRVLTPRALDVDTTRRLVDALEHTEVTMLLRPAFQIRTTVEDGSARPVGPPGT